MMDCARKSAKIYIDRSGSNHWIVRDPDGQFWLVPSQEEDAWSSRSPFMPTEDMNLEAIPGHYKSILGLPF